MTDITGQGTVVEEAVSAQAAPAGARAAAEVPAAELVDRREGPLRRGSPQGAVDRRRQVGGLGIE